MIIMAANDIHDTVMGMFHSLNDDTIETSTVESNNPNASLGEHSIIDVLHIYDAEGPQTSTTSTENDDTAPGEAVKRRKNSNEIPRSEEDQKNIDLDDNESVITVSAISDNATSLDTVTSEQESDDGSVTSSEPYGPNLREVYESLNTHAKALNDIQRSNDNNEKGINALVKVNNKKCNDINNLSSRLDSLENFSRELDSKIHELSTVTLQT